MLLQPLGHLSANSMQAVTLISQGGKFLTDNSKNRQLLFLPKVKANGQLLKSGGEGGIRTHVPCSSQDNSISSRARYGHFGTSPRQKTFLTQTSVEKRIKMSILQ